MHSLAADFKIVASRNMALITPARWWLYPKAVALCTQSIGSDVHVPQRFHFYPAKPRGRQCGARLRHDLVSAPWDVRERVGTRRVAAYQHVTAVFGRGENPRARRSE